MSVVPNDILLIIYNFCNMKTRLNFKEAYKKFYKDNLYIGTITDKDIEKLFNNMLLYYIGFKMVDIDLTKAVSMSSTSNKLILTDSSSIYTTERIVPINYENGENLVLYLYFSDAKVKFPNTICWFNKLFTFYDFRLIEIVIKHKNFYEEKEQLLMILINIMYIYNVTWQFEPDLKNKVLNLFLEVHGNKIPKENIINVYNISKVYKLDHIIKKFYNI